MLTLISNTEFRKAVYVIEGKTVKNQAIILKISNMRTKPPLEEIIKSNHQKNSSYNTFVLSCFFTLYNLKIIRIVSNQSIGFFI
jgi:hypothetical protein